MTTPIANYLMPGNVRFGFGAAKLAGQEAARLDGKIICTNTTTAADVAAFRAAGVRYLVTTTPRLEGRSFGTNMMEAMLVAVSGQGRKLTDAELSALIDQLGFHPNIEPLNA